MQELPQDFITWADMLSLGGASSATFVVGGAIQHVLNRNVRWISLAVALVLGAFLFLTQASEPRLLDWILGLVNGCLIYLTAVGMNSVAAVTTGPVDALGGAAERRSFLTRWL